MQAGNVEQFLMLQTVWSLRMANRIIPEHGLGAGGYNVSGHAM